MKEIKQYITEKLIVNNTISNYLYHPKTKDELIECIKEKIDKEGLGTKDNPLNLNDIDTFEITDMSGLFSVLYYTLDDKLKDLSKNGYFDISKWDVSNVEDMEYMFYASHFNGDISGWNVSNVKNMQQMFYASKFNGDISDWNVRDVENMQYMFSYCPLEKNPPKWYHE